MAGSAGDKHRACLGRKVILTLSLLLMIPVLAYMMLFVWNHFEIRIELKGEAIVYMDSGEEYVEPGVKTRLYGTVFCKNGLEVPATELVSGAVDGDKPGSYTVDYIVEWRTLKANASRMVVVRDCEPPQITLNTIEGYQTIRGQEYQEEGYSAWDNCDGDVTHLVVREEKDGVVSYSVSDQAGNQITVFREIVYCEPPEPVLTLLGDETIYIDAGVGYTEPGYEAMDFVDGDLTHLVEITGTVDKYLAGTYQLTYSVTDSEGYCTELTRTVVVQAKGIPETIVPEGRVIYLTFDDGPSVYTLKLLKVLKEYGVKATFFVMHRDLPDIMKQIVDEGHAIAIHSVTHKYKKIYASADAYFADLLGMQQKIYDATGVMTYLMRFPGGSSNTASSYNEGIMTYLTQAVEDNGFRYFDWNVDSKDAGGAKESEEVYKNVIGGCMRQNVSIVLQHDIHSYSVEAVERIIIWGLANGYQFLPLDMTSPMAHHGVNN